MTDAREQAHQLIDRLPETQVSALVGLLETIVDPVAAALRNAPIDDEQLTAEEDQALSRADAWLEQRGGRGIPHEEVLAEFGLTMKDFPLKENGS
jgi:hypothetical protein